MMHQIQLWLGSTPDFAGGAHLTPQTLKLDFRGPASKAS